MTDPAKLPPWKDTKVVGKPLPRVDGYERVSGSAVFAIDVALPDMLHAAILRCPHAHARVKRVDASKAARLPGVRVVLTGESPGASVPWYASSRAPASRLFDPHCRHEGEEVAAVAAETEGQAREALAAIEVEYEVLPFVVDAAAALQPDAPAVQEAGNRVGPPSIYDRGDLAQGFAEADTVLEQTYRTSCEVHTPLEVHGSVARWERGHLTVWDTTQGVFGVRDELARALGLPLSRVRVVSPYMGGGFGSKLEAGKYTVIAALLARQSERPVRLFLNREEGFLCVGNRPPNVITLKASAKKDGTLTALQLRSLGAAGAYPSGTDVGALVSNLYRCPNVRLEETAVFINAGRARPMRAPGYPQGAWALEQMMDALAEALGLDPVELRLRNVTDVSQTRGVPYTSTGFARCLREGAQAFGWKEARLRPRGTGRLQRGVGMAGAMWGYPGQPTASAVVRLFGDGSAGLTLGASDLGCGTKTVMAMVLAEELGIPVERIAVEHADTGTTPYSPASGGSQTVLVNAPAVRSAAADLRRQVLEIAAEELKRPAEGLALVDGKVVPDGAPQDAVALGDLKACGGGRCWWRSAIASRIPRARSPCPSPPSSRRWRWT